jgi:hypothetical protein
MLSAIASGTEFNAKTYWSTKCNQMVADGDSGNHVCFKKLREIGDQIHAPIVSDNISVKCAYKMIAKDTNREIPAAPKSKGQIILNFQVTNHNEEDMKISNIYVKVIGYNLTNYSNIIKERGIIKSIGYSCKIDPDTKRGPIRCIPSFNENNEYLKIISKKMEDINIVINADIPGVYQLQISLDYAYGNENNTIIVGDLSERIGFFN